MRVWNRKLPLLDTPEGKKVIDRFCAGDRESLREDLGYKTVKTLVDAIKRVYHFVPKKEEDHDDSKVVYKKYPEFDIKPFFKRTRARTKEDIVVVWADKHVGKVTSDYNTKVYQKRMDTLLDKVMGIINLHYPIGKAYILDLGDGIQGENPRQGSKIGETECPAINQIYDYAVPTESRFMISLAQGVESVEFYGVRGNHGKTEHLAPDNSNYDLYRYKALAHANQSQKTLHFHDSESFYQLVNVNGFKIFMVHGDQVRSTQGIPMIAMRRKMQEWYVYLNGFHFGLSGHWHCWGADQINSIADYQICPPLVTGDSWALEVVGRASKPVQLCFGVHPRIGRSWEYQLYCDESHLLRPVRENK